MVHLRRILFPIAFSRAADSLAPFVRELAEEFYAPITVLNAFNPLPEYFEGPSTGDRCIAAEEPRLPYSPALLELRDQQRERLEAFSRRHFSGIGYSARIEDGDPARVIEWVAEHERTDLIMMPTHGLGRFRSLLLGSVTAKILHDTSFPLWTSVHKAELSTSLPHGCRSILCAVKMNDKDAVTLRTATLFAEVYGAKVILLHIQDSLEAHDQRSLTQSIRESFDQACKKEGAPPIRHIEVRILEGGIPQQICKTALQEHADLVIVGRGNTRGVLARTWSHLYAIIRESPSPVLSV